jgi:hypothetical protein
MLTLDVLRMKNSLILLISMLILSPCTAGIENLKILNSPCEDCILVSVVGRGVKNEGKYYLPSEDTLRYIWINEAIEVTFRYPKSVDIYRFINGSKKRITINMKTLIQNPSIQEYQIKEGDIIQIEVH